MVSKAEIAANLRPQQLKSRLQDEKNAGRQLDTNLKFLPEWEMQASELSASLIIVIKHDCVIYLCLF